MIRLSLLLSTVAIAACAHGGSYVPGTKIPYSDNNKSVLDRCEEYRLAVERGDSDALMLMAHLAKRMVQQRQAGGQLAYAT